ncbi:MAG: cupin domain-containing protein [Pirellulales bacterium]|nr:cupin domain-containing protein [Pirellulales bacterium]
MLEYLAAKGGASLERTIRAIGGSWKRWGFSLPLFQNDEIEVVWIRAWRGGYSSRHYHRKKDNVFLVTKGRLLIVSYGPQGPMKEILEPGAVLSVPAGVDHRFVALDDAVAYEIYRATTDQFIRAGDIVRQDAGGVFRGDPLEFDG